MDICQSCGERCDSPAALERHLYRHRGPEKLPCLPIGDAFERAFARRPSEKEIEQAFDSIPWDPSTPVDR